MSRKATSKDKPKGRGGKRKGAGRKPMYGAPMVTRSITMREDAWEIVKDEAAGNGLSQGDWIQRRILPPAMVAAMEASQISQG